MSKSPYTSFSTHIDPALKEALLARAKAEGVTVRSIVEEALRNHLAGGAPAGRHLSRMPPDKRVEHGAEALAFLWAQGSLRITIQDRGGSTVCDVAPGSKQGRLEPIEADDEEEMLVLRVTDMMVE